MYGWLGLCWASRAARFDAILCGIPVRLNIMRYSSMPIPLRMPQYHICLNIMRHASISCGIPLCLFPYASGIPLCLFLYASASFAKQTKHRIGAATGERRKRRSFAKVGTSSPLVTRRWRWWVRDSRTCWSNKKDGYLCLSSYSSSDNKDQR